MEGSSVWGSMALHLGSSYQPEGGCHMGNHCYQGKDTPSI